MYINAYLPTKIELPQAVQHNADGDVGIIEFQAYNGVTLQVIVTPNSDGSLGVRLRGWGNKPMRLGNSNKFTLNATINPQEQDSCEVCGSRLGTCGCETVFRMEKALKET